MHQISVQRAFVGAVLAAAVSAPVRASAFTYTGSGGSIPDPLSTPGTWNVTYTGVPLTSSVNVTSAVTSVTAVTLLAFTHTRRGDLHIILRSPSAAFNLVVRPGSTGGAAVGDSGDYLFSTYDFVESGGGTVAQGAANITGGTYNQFFNTGTGQWTAGISNTPLSAITGPIGTWTLEIRDWANLDVGTLHGWRLQGFDTSPGSSYCGAGDPNLTQPCQGSSGAPGNGCENSAATGGAALTATGDPATDTVVVTQTGELAAALSVVLQGDADIPAGVQFGDGVRCAGGNLKRLYTKNAVGGMVTAPQGGDPSIKTQSAALGDPIPPGATRFYQVYYRDPASVSGLNFNVGNALQIVWP